MLSKVRYLLCILCFVFTGWASAQSRFAVRGSVSDPTGAAISGAQVVLQATRGIVVKDTLTDAKGAFALVGVPAGDYSLVVPGYAGFAARTMILHVGSDVNNLKVRLEPDSVSQQVTVGADQALVPEASENRDAVAVTSVELHTLPVFDQNYIAALTPFLDAGSTGSGGVTLIVDGIEMKGVGVSPSAIQEVKINNDPYSAEFARPGRGRIEIITKPGSPEFHGEVNFLFRDALFNAKNHFATVRPPEARRIYEGHLTGPLGTDRHTTFIASGSRREEDTAVAVDAVGPAGAIHQNVLTPNRNSQAALRVNHDFSETHRFSIGYNFEYDTTVNQGVGGIVLPEAGYNDDSREDDLLLNDRLILSPNLLNQLLVTFEKDEDVTASVTNAQAIEVNGSFIGGGAQADLARSENTVHINEIVTWSRGRHSMRFGVQLPQVSRRAVDDHTNRLGTFKFASLANYSSNTPYVFTAQQGVGRGVYWINQFGSFFEDQVKLTPKLQLAIGLRYDWQTFLNDANNFDPRVSLSYAPDKGKTILRLGAGIFYDRTGGDFPATVVLHDGVVLHSVQVQNPTYPLQAGTDLSKVPTDLVRFDKNVRTPYSIQYNLSVERQLHKSMTVTAGYRGFVQVKSFRSRDVNAPILPADPSLTAVYPRPDANFGEIQQIESAGRALQNAFDVSFRGRAGQVFEGQAQYTLSRWMNNSGGIRTFPQDQYRPNAYEWGRANMDRRHKFNLIGTIHPGHWLSLGVSATLYSGLPYTQTTGNDDFHTGLANARPAGVARNTLQGGGVASLDLLYNHDFQLTKVKGDQAKVLTAGVSAFNVLNRTNYTTYIGALTSRLYDQPTAALPGRQLQFSVGYRF